MLQVKYYPFDLEFKYLFTTYKGTKTNQPVLVVALAMGRMYGLGEVGAISYYDVTIEKMIAQLEAKKREIERYALTTPERFWHFLHHLMPGENFLIAALDIATWDMYAKMKGKPLYQVLGLQWENPPITDYTIGIGDTNEIVSKLKENPWPLYKIKMGSPHDIDTIRTIRNITTAAIRVDANEGWTFDEAKRILPELAKLNVSMVEQPLNRNEHEAQKELKQISPIPLFADESCVEERDVVKCADGFHGVNIKLTKCGGITPALRMIQEAKKLGLKTMIGAMCESTIGTAAIAHLMPLLDEVDADGPLLLREDVATGLTYEQGHINITGEPGLGIRFMGKKFEK